MIGPVGVLLANALCTIRSTRRHCEELRDEAIQPTFAGSVAPAETAPERQAVGWIASAFASQ